MMTTKRRRPNSGQEFTSASVSIHEPKSKKSDVFWMHTPLKERVINARSLALKQKQAALRDAVQTSRFKYLHEVKGHRACVNAVSFSRGTGQWMASGGDDTRILVRDLFDFDAARGEHPEASTYRTRARLLGHTSNIFSLSWTADNAKLFSGGNDSLVLLYDLHRGDAPVENLTAHVNRRMADEVLSEHDSSIREVSAHPTNPSLVLSSDDGGQVYLLDLRLPGPHVAAGGHVFSALQSAQWNPNPSDGHTFAVASSNDKFASTGYAPWLTSVSLICACRLAACLQCSRTLMQWCGTLPGCDVSAMTVSAQNAQTQQVRSLTPRASSSQRILLCTSP